MSVLTLLARCRDQTGIVAALSDFVFRNGGNIVTLDQYSDPESGNFQIRLVWDASHFLIDRTGIEAGLTMLTRRFAMEHSLTDDSREQRVAVFASTTGHCLYDLLLRQEQGEFAGRIVQVIANHPDLQPVCAHFGVPFRCIPMTSDKAAVEREQRAILADQGVDLAVLARYMQVLSPEFVAHWQGRMINIHHSFLPAFAGAKPYHQARARGVKIIGATAHYVTAQLDEGPIIEQDVTRVAHSDTVEDLVRKGRDLERQVLSRAVRLHLERRIIQDGNRTIIFR